VNDVCGAAQGLRETVDGTHETSPLVGRIRSMPVPGRRAASARGRTAGRNHDKGSAPWESMSLLPIRNAVVLGRLRAATRH
jgi:hypothetical protein